MTKLVALLSALTVCSGLSTAVAQQAPAENKGMKAEALSGFPLGKQGLDDLAQRQMRIRKALAATDRTLNDRLDGLRNVRRRIGAGNG